MCVVYCMEKKKLMPERFKELAKYNTRVSLGIVHTKEYQLRMKILQKDYWYWIRTK